MTFRKSVIQSDKQIVKQFNQYKRRAIKNSTQFDLTLFSFYAICKNNCYICKTKQKKYNGVDRFDNDEGYTDFNSFACCWKCNRAKNNMTVEEFIEWIGNLNPVLAKEITQIKKYKNLCVKFNNPNLKSVKNNQINTSLYFLKKEDFKPVLYQSVKINFDHRTRHYLNTFKALGTTFSFKSHVKDDNNIPQSILRLLYLEHKKSLRK